MLTNTAGNVALLLKTAANNRAVVQFGSRAGFEHPACALLGTVLTKAPGSVALKFRKPAGVTADPLTDTQVANLRISNVNFNTAFGTVAFNADGKVANGEWADVIRDRDFAVADIQTEIANVLLANDKLPFTDSGIACLASGVRASLKRQQEAGIWAPGWTITVPAVADVSSGNKTARNLPGLNFSATLAGAIFSTTINGTISF